MGAKYEPSVVGFIDVLGFRQLVRSHTAPKIMSILDILKHYSKGGEFIEADQMRDQRIMSGTYSFQISDAIVRARPYETEWRDGAFYNELLDLLYAQIGLIQHGVLIRAGVTVGDVHVGEKGAGPVFGPGMIRAYEIESSEAIFPRIVVDDAAVAEHRTNPKLRNQDNSAEFENEAIGRLIAQGEDGTWFIDYLVASRSEFDDPVGYYFFLEKHAALIRDGFAEAHELRARRKYIWLSRYHNSCISGILESANSVKVVETHLLSSDIEICGREYLESLIVKIDV